MSSPQKNSLPLSLAPSSTHSHSWQLHHHSMQSQKNFNMLLRRINVLSQQRNTKLRTLQTNLQRHYQFVMNKVQRSKEHKQLHQKLQKYNTSRELSTTLSKITREQQRVNLSRIRETMQKMKENQGRRIRDQRREEDRERREENKRREEENAKKRNFIRLGELESRQKVSRFWERRIMGLRQQKEYQTMRTMESLNMSISKIEKLEMSEASLIKYLIKTDAIKDDLDCLMSEQKSLQPEILANKYQIKQDHLSTLTTLPTNRPTDKFKKIDVQFTD